MECYVNILENIENSDHVQIFFWSQTESKKFVVKSKGQESTAIFYFDRCWPRLQMEVH